MVGFENGVFQVECLAMIADPMGTLSKLLKCDSFLRPVFQLEVGRKKKQLYVNPAVSFFF